LRVRGEDREPLLCEVGAERLVEQLHHQWRVGEVEGLRHISFDDEGVDRRPWLGLVAEQREHHVELMRFLRLVDPVVDALGVGGQRDFGGVVGLGPFQLRGSQEAKL
jgi:hypothetical protein